MRGVFLFVAHSQTIEWVNSARFFNLFPENSILRTFDILAYVNSTNVSAGEVEGYLDLFPNKVTRMLYTPCNGHSVDPELDLDCPSNIYKNDTTLNRMGYWYGIIEAYASTYDLVKKYDYVIQLNPDVYVTDDRAIEEYLVKYQGQRYAHHVNSMRGDVRNGFSTDFHIYCPKVFERNHFSDYKIGETVERLRQQKDWDNRYRFVPEQLLRALILESQCLYRVMGPSTRNDRQIDRLGLWHCHENESVTRFFDLRT